MKHEIRFSGFGGQGIILAGHIMGEAATLHTDLNATLTQSYGPESRGGACAAELILADEPIHFPHVIEPNLLVAMSQEAYNKYAPEMDEKGLIIIDETLVDPEAAPHHAPILSVPATQIAGELKKPIVANIVMLGFVTGVANLVPETAMRETILNRVPPQTRDLNSEAFSRGMAHAKTAELRGVSR